MKREVRALIDAAAAELAAVERAAELKRIEAMLKEIAENCPPSLWDKLAAKGLDMTDPEIVAAVLEAEDQIRKGYYEIDHSRQGRAQRRNRAISGGNRHSDRRATG